MSQKKYDRDTIVVFWNKWLGEYETSLETWMTEGPPFYDPYVSPIRIKHKSGKYISLTNIPLRYRNSPFSRKMIMYGILEEPWPHYKEAVRRANEVTKRIKKYNPTMSYEEKIQKIKSYSYIWEENKDNCVLLTPGMKRYRLALSNILYKKHNALQWYSPDDYMIHSNLIAKLKERDIKSISEEDLEYSTNSWERAAEQLNDLWSNKSTYALISIENAPLTREYIIYNYRKNSWIAPDPWIVNVYTKMINVGISILSSFPTS